MPSEVLDTGRQSPSRLGEALGCIDDEPGAGVSPVNVLDGARAFRSVSSMLILFRLHAYVAGAYHMSVRSPGPQFHTGWLVLGVPFGRLRVALAQVREPVSGA